MIQKQGVVKMVFERIKRGAKKLLSKIKKPKEKVEIKTTQPKPVAPKPEAKPQDVVSKGEEPRPDQPGFASPVTPEDIADVATLGAGSVFKLGTRRAIPGAISLATKPATRGVITRTASEIGKFGNTMTTQRGFIGRGGKTVVDKLFKKLGGRAPTASRFAENTKSKRLTTSLHTKAGMSLGAASLAISAIGSYPFAGFIKEEALQTLGFGLSQAIDNDDFDGADLAIAEQKELLNPGTTQQIIGWIPYANVAKQVLNFFEAAAIKLSIDEKRLAKKRTAIESDAPDKFEQGALDREDIKQRGDEAKSASIELSNLQRRKSQGTITGPENDRLIRILDIQASARAANVN